MTPYLLNTKDTHPLLVLLPAFSRLPLPVRFPSFPQTPGRGGLRMLRRDEPLHGRLRRARLAKREARSTVNPVGADGCSGLGCGRNGLVRCGSRNGSKDRMRIGRRIGRRIGTSTATECRRRSSAVWSGRLRSGYSECTR